MSGEAGSTRVSDFLDPDDPTDRSRGRSGGDFAEHWDGPDRHPLLLETSRRDVFAFGDVRRGSTKRVASAVGDGALVVRSIHEPLNGAAATAGRAK